MPRATSTRKIRQSRKDAATRPATPGATNSKIAHGQSPKRDAVPDMSNPLSVPYVDPQDLWDSCTVPGHRYRFAMVDTPEFHEASKKLAQAWLDQVPEGESPPVYSSIYSYTHEYVRIPKNTPIPPGLPPTSFGGTVRQMTWTEDMVNIMLKAEFGDVELGHQFMKKAFEGSEVIGGSPDPKDPSIRYIPIPGRKFHLRLWTGRMDQAELVCWQFIDNITKKPRGRPDKVKIYDVNDPTKPAHLISFEESEHFDQRADGRKAYSCETFSAPDGTIVDFVHGKQPFMRIQLPIRSKAGPPAIGAYIEHKLLPVDPKQVYKVVKDRVDNGNPVIVHGGQGDGAQQDSDSDAD
ncbi:hypothetical protein K525DRAFT_201914 [Schizophyllum commune Loenen D]|nr:hypothetical protein K525DRAFT_201914 [Schizophyllum commune Loenen D]